jgi:FtsP/CotA-like multicopper oxidase with cupredoxin domain
MRGPGSQQDKGPDFSVNGRQKPVLNMRPGEVQMWRIVNTSGRAAMFFEGVPAGFEVRQLAQDGVQFKDINYKRRQFKNIVVASGNRVDILVKAPPAICSTAGGCKYNVMVKNMVDPSDLTGTKAAKPLTLLTVNVTGTPVDPNSNGAKFIPNAPAFPPFLKDVDDKEISGTKRLVFGSTPPGNPPAQPAMHTIDNKKFDGEVGEVVLLNRAEEWKVENATYGPKIAHPFHIHINPFQVTEIFDPNEALLNPKTGKPYVDTKGNPVIDPHTNRPAVKYVFWKDKLLAGQCYLNPDDPASWKPMTWRALGCVPTPVPPNVDNIWWDVFPIPSGYAPSKAGTDSSGNPTSTPILNTAGQPIQVPGYFKMRSRFVDFPGFYVLHCHILAHEDRGMMTIVEVAPARTPYSHN